MIPCSIHTKRAFNLLWGVNQGCSHLLARGLEKGQPGVLVNTRRRLNALLDKLRHLTVFWPKFNRWELYYFLIQHFLLIFRITPKDITVFRLYRSTIWSIFRTQQLQMRKMYCKAPNLLPQWNSLGILDIMHSQLPNNGILKQSHYII